MEQKNRLLDKRILLQEASNILRDISILIREKRYKEAERQSNYYREELLPLIRIAGHFSNI